MALCLFYPVKAVIQGLVQRNIVACIFSDKGAKPTVVQLAKGSVEEVQIKGQLHVLKLTSTLQGERSLYMSFASPSEYGKWMKKTKKVGELKLHRPPSPPTRPF